MSSVTLDEIDKVYGHGKEAFHAVHSIDLVVRDREFMVLVGPSGCGKSTTLRMIAGLEEITGGTLKIGDRVVNAVQPKNRGIAMVFQNYALYPHMSVFDNMAFGLKLARMPKTEIRERVREAAEILGLQDLLGRKPKALSGGQRQRVALGRAIVRKPEVFLFDEPLSNLDAKMRVQMRAEISKLHAQLQATMVYVTHDQIEAMTMGDRICVMHDGIIMQVGDPMEIYNTPANKFVAGFIGSPPMNFFDGRVLEREGKIHFREDPGEGGHGFDVTPGYELAAKLKDRANSALTFGIRAEDIELAMEEGAESHLVGTIDVAEIMGAETYLYLNSESGHSFIARVKPTHRFQVGDRVPLRFNLERAHFFDPETEKALA